MAAKKKKAKSKAKKGKAAPKKKAVSKKTKSTKKVTKKAGVKKTAAVKKPKSKAAPKKKTATKSTASKPKARQPKLDQRLKPNVAKLRARLILDRNRLLRLIASSQEIERNVGELTFSNEIDLASSLEGREMAFQLSSRERNEMKLIDSALVKINQGTYGNCDNCTKKIGAKRLQIMPLTPMCIDCQESMED